MMDGASITAIRTAAVSAVATRLLAREDASELALLGSGVQARTHLEALLAVRPVSRVRVWSRTAAHSERFASEESQKWSLPIESVATPREAVEGADLVCTVTLSQEPVLAGEWLRPGAHINAVGSCTPNARELDATTVARSRLWVDRRESCLAEAGNFLLARREGAVDDAHIQGEIGDLLLAKVTGRKSRDEITLFESLGLAVEDLAVARFLFRKAQEEGVGSGVELA
jgi:ornithine cyclodeaminase